MFTKGRLILGACAAGLLLAGCAMVEESSERAREVATDVGGRVEYHAQKVKRKTQSLWQRIFGGGGSTSDRKTRANPDPSPPPASATQLPNYPQQYVGKPG